VEGLYSADPGGSRVPYPGRNLYGAFAVKRLSWGSLFLAPSIAVRSEERASKVEIDK
jgi:hypothetical protein